MNASPRTGRIVLLTTSHRVAPGLLSWPAWEALRAAGHVVCGDPEHPLLPYVREAGVDVVTGPLPTARELVEACSEGRTTVVIAAAEGEPQLTDGLAALAGSGRTSMPELELLPGSYDLPGARVLDLVQVMDSIRRDCPWSGARTHEGLVKYGIEEMYELVEAIEEDDRGALCEELGDVLLQVVFHARIAQEDPEEPFTIDDVAGGIVEKLIHRHPHVFGEEQAATAEEVREHWLRTKAVEKRRDSVTEGIPLGQPALALAAKLAQRVRLAELDVTPEPGGPGRAGGADGGVGGELLALAVRAEAEGIDPETALRAAARRYRDAIRAAESEIADPE
ncbi:nucleoside triphosphate hydrolase [Streptomyces abyssalis]|uniref:Nucleoside triphosphate hydrolase n=1 Tax=Streptomyces abyssalis TaxID=933944 RepID=A0A1E7JMD6_9ACTN|nr:nucleoside triphosphate pyrophosphohydrolase [Streptomyces abyssalis]OEU87075.1 nucleoside triphosphate hydrolase [Streptomyces abyssalis]OEU89036.1 nucleoside triphosphate hydrolase [Streptomyces abyssalis]OEV29744.1 nucleoside triphosphate hydrolase [Streptomyces nanshensis]